MAYNTEFNDILLSLMESHLNNEFSFRILIKNDENWSQPLPQEIAENHKETIVLDIVNWSFENFIIDKENNYVNISVFFGEVEYSKKVFIEDFLAILTIQGMPIIVKPFNDEKKVEISQKERSLNAFKRNMRT